MLSVRSNVYMIDSLSIAVHANLLLIILFNINYLFVDS